MPEKDVEKSSFNHGKQQSIDVLLAHPELLNKYPHLPNVEDPHSADKREWLEA